MAYLKKFFFKKIKIGIPDNDDLCRKTNAVLVKLPKLVSTIGHWLSNQFFKRKNQH